MHKRTSRTALNRLRPELRGLLVVAVAALLLCGALTLMGNGSDSPTTLAAAEPTATEPVAAAAGADVDPSAASTTTVAGVAGTPTTTAVGDLSATTTVAGEQAAAGAAPTTGENCKITVRSTRLGDTGESVTCLQQALISRGLYDGTATGTFDSATQEAVRAMQAAEESMYVDGIVGRETALALGIWPDEDSLVVRTPPPPAGAKDPTGHPLSPVASTGADAPPLPENSGSGRRLVYSRAGQRVWAVDGDGTILRSWLVSGSKYNNEQPGTHKVYSKSPESTAWNGKAILPMMVRWLKTQKGAIGFHGIPIKVSDGSVYQTDKELGTRLSGGCQRQNNLDAKFVWDWADIGTVVVVV